MKKSILSIVLLLSILSSYTQNIPSPKSFLGYEIGQRFTPHHKIVSYFETLAKAAPQQMKLEQYGVTNEGRPLLLAYIGSSQNLANLENIRLNNLKLAGFEGGNGNASAPAIVWMSYNVHGNEASSSEAVMKTAHFLLTDAKAQEWLKSTVDVAPVGSRACHLKLWLIVEAGIGVCTACWPVVNDMHIRTKPIPGEPQCSDNFNLSGSRIVKNPVRFVGGGRTV